LQINQAKAKALEMFKQAAPNEYVIALKGLKRLKKSPTAKARSSLYPATFNQLQDWRAL
jgi:hypothetical protein